MPSLVDITGNVFNRLTVIGRNPANAKEGQARWDCTCECGNLVTATGGDLRNGKQQSCGCYRAESSTNRATVHDMCGTPAHVVWGAMRSRCNNPKHVAYKNYGGRGIRVCSRWDTFANFYSDMWPRPAGLSMDRIDNDGNYEPGNCRWATRKEQNTNTRRQNIAK